METNRLKKIIRKKLPWSKLENVYFVAKLPEIMVFFSSKVPGIPGLQIRRYRYRDWPKAGVCWVGVIEKKRYLGNEDVDGSHTNRGKERQQDTFGGKYKNQGTSLRN